MFLGQATLSGTPVQVPGQQLMMLATPNVAQATPTLSSQPLQYVFQQTEQQSLTQAQVPTQQNLQITATTASPRGIIQNLIATPFGPQAAQVPQPIQIQNFSTNQLQQFNNSLQFVNTANTIPQTFVLNPQQMQLQPAQMQHQQTQQYAVAATPQVQAQPQMVQYMLPNGQIVQTIQSAAPTLQLQPVQYNPVQQIHTQPGTPFFTAQPNSTAFFQQTQPTPASFIASPNGTEQTAFIQAQATQQQLVPIGTQQTQATLISPQQIAAPTITTQQAAPSQQFMFQPTLTDQASLSQNHVIQQQNAIHQPLLIPSCNQSPVMLLTSNANHNTDQNRNQNTYHNTNSQTLSPIIVKNCQTQSIVSTVCRNTSSKRHHEDSSNREITSNTSHRKTLSGDVRWNKTQVPQNTNHNNDKEQNSNKLCIGTTQTTPPYESEKIKSDLSLNQKQSLQVSDSRPDEEVEEIQLNECANDQATQCDDYETDENHNQRSDSECESSLKISQEEQEEESESVLSSKTEIQCFEEDIKKESEDDSCHFTDSEDDDDDDEQSEGQEMRMVSKNGLTQAAYELINNKLLDESPQESKESKKNIFDSEEEEEAEEEEEYKKEEDEEKEKDENENMNEVKDSNILYYHTSSPGSVASSVNSQNQESSNAKGFDRHILNIKERFFNGIDLDEIREFAKRFKLFRQSLDLTQSEVGNDLGKLANISQSYSQSAICRFENLDVTPKSALKIKPILESWIVMSRSKYKNILENTQDSDNGDNCENKNSKKNSMKINFMFDTISGQLDSSSLSSRLEPGKKRKKRTSFNPIVLEQLNQHFLNNPKPNSEEMTRIAKTLNYEKDVVRVWFCNKRQTLKAKKLSLSNTNGCFSSGSSPLSTEVLLSNNDINEIQDINDLTKISSFPFSTNVPRISFSPSKTSPIANPFPVQISQTHNSLNSISIPRMFDSFESKSSKNQLLPPPFTVQKNMLSEKLSTLLPVSVSLPISVLKKTST